MTKDAQHRSTAPPHQQALLARILQAVESADGALPFDAFMELVLYAPGLGYYTTGSVKLGAAGDFVTAPEISPLFARCLAAQVAEVFDQLTLRQQNSEKLAPRAADILEFGAGSGILAADLLEELARLKRLPDRYLILELSPDLAARQRDILRERLPELVNRVHWISQLPEHFNGVMLANEVLDAMPVHRFRIKENGDAEELFITEWQAGGLQIIAGPIRSPGLAEAIRILQAQGLANTHGYESEINLRMGPWMRALAESLSAGMALLIDYGYPRAEYYLPERDQGTLLCHYRHQAHADPLAYLGLQDITAHVDFTALAQAGLDAGLQLAGYSTQANFLLGCGLDQRLAEASQNPDELLTLAAGAKQLVLPSAMGERFQVMAFTRSLTPPGSGWCGFSSRDLSARL